jgi:hypothetical protein
MIIRQFSTRACGYLALARSPYRVGGTGVARPRSPPARPSRRSEPISRSGRRRSSQAIADTCLNGAIAQQTAGSRGHRAPAKRGRGGVQARHLTRDLARCAARTKAGDVRLATQPTDASALAGAPRPPPRRCRRLRRLPDGGHRASVSVRSATTRIAAGIAAATRAAELDPDNAPHDLLWGPACAPAADDSRSLSNAAARRRLGGQGRPKLCNARPFLPLVLSACKRPVVSARMPARRLVPTARIAVSGGANPRVPVRQGGGVSLPD